MLNKAATADLTTVNLLTANATSVSNSAAAAAASRSRSNSINRFFSFGMTPSTAAAEISTKSLAPSMEKSLSLSAASESSGSSSVLRTLLPAFDLKSSSSSSSSPRQAESSSCAMNNSSSTSSLAISFIDPMELKNELDQLSSGRPLLKPTQQVILLDCRTKTDFNFEHIKDSVHLNCRDNIIRKRLKSRKLTVKDLISNEEIKSKLETTPSTNAAKTYSSAAASCSSAEKTSTSNETDEAVVPRSSSSSSKAAMTRPHSSEDVSKSDAAVSVDDMSSTTLDSQISTTSESDKQVKKAKSFEDIIVLYDDTTSDLNDLQVASNPLKIVQENIKQCGYNKECKILKGGFKKFVEMWPNFCVFKEKCEQVVRSVQGNIAGDEQQPCDTKQSDIDNAVMNEILPHLYLGNESDARNERRLEESNIFYVLNITKTVPFSQTSNPKFVHKRIAVDDCGRSSLKNHFEEAIEFIELARENNSKVLVHCQAGISRSPTVVIAYLISKYGMKLNEAYNKVREIRPIVSPNIGFFGQLMDFESKVKAKSDTTTATAAAAAAVDDVKTGAAATAEKLAQEAKSFENGVAVAAGSRVLNEINVNTTNNNKKNNNNNKSKLADASQSGEKKASHPSLKCDVAEDETSECMDFLNRQSHLDEEMDIYEQSHSDHHKDQKMLEHVLVCH